MCQEMCANAKAVRPCRSVFAARNKPVQFQISGSLIAITMRAVTIAVTMCCYNCCHHLRTSWWRTRRTACRRGRGLRGGDDVMRTPRALCTHNSALCGLHAHTISAAAATACVHHQRRLRLCAAVCGAASRLAPSSVAGTQGPVMWCVRVGHVHSGNSCSVWCKMAQGRGGGRR